MLDCYDNEILKLRCTIRERRKGKLDTEEELYDEITIETDKYLYVGFNESRIKYIKVI